MKAIKKFAELPALIIIVIVLLGLYLVYILMIFLAKLFVFLGFNLFVVIDNFMKVESFSPIVVWAFLGLMIGGVLGVVIAVKKYKLSKKLIIYPVSVFLFFIGIFYLVHDAPTNSGSTLKSDEKQVETIQTGVVSDGVASFIASRDCSIRATPSLRSKKLLSITKGTRTEYLKTTVDSKKNIWYKVKHIDSQTGKQSIGYIVGGKGE